MKKKFRFISIFTLAITILCSCSKSSIKIDSFKDKVFANKENLIYIVGKENKMSKIFKENDLVLISLKNPSSYKIFKNAKVTKKDKKNFLTCDNLTLNLEIENEKTLKDTDKNVEYKEIDKNDIEKKNIFSKLDSENKVDVTDEIDKISNKSFTSDSGVSIIVALHENKELSVFVKENGKEKNYKNAKLVKENGKTYVKADNFPYKLLYKSINMLVDENTNIEYKLNNKR